MFAFAQAADDIVTAERWVQRHMQGGPALGLQAHTDRDNLNGTRGGVHGNRTDMLDPREHGRSHSGMHALAPADYMLVYGQARL